ncbi:MAG TPA: SPOR domain-containing protein [Stellaceae bacterium]
MSDTESRRRSNLASATVTAVALIFCFGVGLAGGAAYKVYFRDNAGPNVADLANPAAGAPAPPAAPVQNFAANASSEADKAVADSTRTDPPALPALAPPPPPTTAQAAPPHAPSTTVAQAAPNPPPVPRPAPQAGPVAPPAPASDVDFAPAMPDPPPAPQTARPQLAAAIPPKKPAITAKAQETPTPQTVVQHVPAAATAAGNSAPPFRVQFGVFASEDNARRMQWAIEATGLKIDVSQEQGPSGHALFFVRSPSYPDYASALSAAQTVHDRAQHLVNPVSIDYAILGNRSAPDQRAQMP